MVSKAMAAPYLNDGVLILNRWEEPHSPRVSVSCLVPRGYFAGDVDAVVIP